MIQQRGANLGQDGIVDRLCEIDAGNLGPQRTGNSMGLNVPVAIGLQAVHVIPSCS